MKPILLFVSPGPTYVIRESYYAEMSKHFSGYIITTSNKPEICRTQKVGDFHWHCIQSKYKIHLFNQIIFIAKSLLWCVKMRRNTTKVDLVSTYDPLLTGFIGMLCAKLLKVKFAPQVNGVYTSPAEYIDNGRSISTLIKKYFYPKLENIVLSQADGVKILFPTQLSPFLKILPGKTIHHFANFINIQPFLETKIVNDTNEILFTGFPFKRKGVDILIEAFKQVAGKHPAWRLKILGWYPDKTELNRAIDGHAQIFHHKPVMPTAMPEHLAQCSICVLPSRSEAMGRILIEAMASGKARIGANVDGIPTVINNGVDGMLFNCCDIQDLSSKLDTLMSNPELRIKMGNAGRERAKKEFNTSLYFCNLNNFFLEVLNNH